VNNALSSGASSLYLRRFGVGVGEWRVLSMLAVEPGIRAARICAVVALDKGAVSRSLKRLVALGCVAGAVDGGDPRARRWRLTEAGRALHDRILEVALERERRLIDGADPDDVEAFLRVMRLMRRNVDSLDAPHAPDRA
jgi:DNA-binding MarR family transcriptional regulator